jgi:hypothetical protein
MSDQATTWVNSDGGDVEFKNDQGAPDVSEVADPPPPFQDLGSIAELGWQAQLAWEHILGELPRLDWEDLPDKEKINVVFLVKWLLDNPTSSVSAQHDAWRARKAADGWKDGERKDYQALTNPYMKPFDDLSPLQQRKARLWRHIIFAMVG